eukprot:5141270-Amphidinium_carterae.1
MALIPTVGSTPASSSPAATPSSSTPGSISFGVSATPNVSCHSVESSLRENLRNTSHRRCGHDFSGSNRLVPSLGNL